jgi:signal transduction histidine kinase
MNDELPFLRGGGEMGSLIREHDWTSTSLGSPHTWSGALRTAVRLMLSTGHPMYIWWGEYGACLYNDAYRQSIGPERHPYSLGRPAIEVWTEIWDIIGPQIDQVMNGGQSTWHEDQLVPITRNGQKEDVYWTYSYSPIYDETVRSGIGGVLVVCSETTQKILAEKRLAAQTQRQRQLFEQAPGFIAVLGGPRHIFQFANEAYYRLVGRPVSEAVPDVDGQGFFELLDQVYKSGERFVAARVPITFTRNIITGETDERFLDFIYAPTFDEDGLIDGVFVEGHDVTDRVRLEEDLLRDKETLEERVAERTAELEQFQEQMRHSQKLEAMGQLTGGIAHDFNNLLTPIVGGLDMLVRKNIGGERDQRLMRGALESAERAKLLVQRLLAFARRQPLQTTPVNLGDLLNGMRDLIASTVGPQTEVIIEIADALPCVIADQNQIEMALLNLSVNARDAMPDGGTLTIAAELTARPDRHKNDSDETEFVCLSVADTGIGMDEATCLRAVEPFFSTKGIGKGTGLGLSMVHGLAAQLGGGFKLSSSKGFGTTAALWLPVSSNDAQAAQKNDGDKPAHRSKGTVLLVDDEDLVRASTAEMLIELGYKVVEARSSNEAIEQLDNGLTIGFLITDHLMPGMTGIELGHEVARRRPNTPILIVSGYAQAEGVAPDLPRLTKPFRLSDLAASLDRIRC